MNGTPQWKSLGIYQSRVGIRFFFFSFFRRLLYLLSGDGMVGASSFYKDHPGMMIMVEQQFSGFEATNQRKFQRAFLHPTFPVTIGCSKIVGVAYRGFVQVNGHETKLDGQSVFGDTHHPKSILLGTSDISHDDPMIVPVYRHVLMFPAAGSGCSSHGVQPDSCRGALSSCRTSPKITGWFLLCRNNQDFNGHQWTKQTKIIRYCVWWGSIMALIMIYYDSYGY